MIRRIPTPLFLTACIAYAVAGFLTFGYGVNRACEYRSEVKDIGGEPFLVSGWNDGCNAADAAAGILSPLWPIYWAGRAAMAVTK